MTSSSSQRDETIEESPPDHAMDKSKPAKDGAPQVGDKSELTGSPGSEGNESDATLSSEHSAPSSMKESNSPNDDMDISRSGPSWDGSGKDSSGSSYLGVPLQRTDPPGSDGKARTLEPRPLPESSRSSPPEGIAEGPSTLPESSSSFPTIAKHTQTTKTPPIEPSQPRRDVATEVTSQPEDSVPSIGKPIEKVVPRVPDATKLEVPKPSSRPHPNLAGAATWNSRSSDQSMAHSSRSSGSAQSSLSGVSPPPSIVPIVSFSSARNPKQNKASVLGTDMTANLAPTAPSPSVAAQGSSKSKPSSRLRRGKWTVEEEAYVARVIQDFNSGFLNAPAGTTLRSYLSDKLHCDPMRITKKFTGESCIGKRVFHPAVRCSSNAAAIDKAQAELDALERRWRRRLEMQQRESAKKAAASAAAAAAAASGRSHMHGHINQGPVQQGAVPSQVIMQHPSVPVAGGNVKQQAVAQTASWLDRANAVLSGNSTAPLPKPASSHIPGKNEDTSTSSVESPTEIERQMKRVQQLIHEGPIIQQTTVGLPHLLDGSAAYSGSRKISDAASGISPPTSTSPPPPVDKRPRTNSTASKGEEQDAEALVGFLNSVRASAATSGNDISG